MLILRKLFAAVLFLTVTGCGSATTLSTAPLTDQQKAEIKARDLKTDEEENAANTKKKKK